MKFLLLTLVLAAAGSAAPIEIFDRQTVVPSKGRHYGFPRVLLNGRDRERKRVVAYLSEDNGRAFAGSTAADIAITPLDNYEQWKGALNTGADDPPPPVTLLPGFEIERLRTAQPEEGSWIALCFDPKGRVIIAREKRGLLRFTLAPGPIQVETIDDTLLEVRGLLPAFGALYANANVSRGLFRLRDTTGADRFDQVTLLQKTAAGGHGRNSLALGPDGFLALINGDSVTVPEGVRRLTPPLVPGLLPGDTLPHGHLLRVDRDGAQGALVASGLRNPVGVDFNADGEPFTYDADAETDMGTPWYRPTHVRHLVSGADFGWRRVTGRWPPYYPDQPDNPPVTLATGKGSPTAIKFGTRSSFPPAYRRALFILDWSYGRIMAMHFAPSGASYTARAETFLRGRPLNVTGLDFGPDGAMYFVTGGRNTRSALYRVRHAGPAVTEPPESADERARNEKSITARALRRQLEAFHGRADPRAVDQAWARLDHGDPWIAHAARVAIEHQPPAAWARRALTEPEAARALPALMALTRVGPDEFLSETLARLTRIPPASLSPGERRVYVRTAGLVTQRLGRIERGGAEPMIRRLDTLVSGVSPELDRETIRLLLQLESPKAVGQAVSRLAAAKTQEDKLHYLQLLGRVRTGWTDEDRVRYFRVLAQAPTFRGGAGLPNYLRTIEQEALASVPEQERPRFAAMLASRRETTAPTVASSEPRPIVRAWTMADLEGSLGAAGRNRDFQRGRRLFAEALCVLCHQLGDEGRPAGPDLTDVASRFSRREILESIVEPSRVVSETYRTVVVTTKQGGTVSGSVAPADFRLPVLRLAPDPLAPERVVEVRKDDIAAYVESEVSPMPPGLVNRLSREEILDLIAYVEAGADPSHANFAR